MTRTLFIATLVIVAAINPLGASQEVPEQLFGIRLGSIHDLGDDDSDAGTLPVKRFTGLQRFLGSGIHYYFEPIKEYSAFPYVEKPEEIDDDYFPTSFRLYLLPEIPPTVESSDQLADANIAWRVALIEWSLNDNSPDEVETEAGEPDFAEGLKEHKAARYEDYLWALDLCATFKADLTIDPEVTDYRDTHYYECSFSNEHRILSITSYPFKIVQLRFTEEIFNSMDDEVERRLYQLKAENIRPY